MDVNRCVCCGDPIPEGIMVCPLCEQGYADRYITDRPESERRNVMTREDWLRKLTSRKFWLAVAGLVTGIVTFLRHPSTDAEVITGLIMALGSVVAYCIGEGLADAAGAHAEQTVTYYVEPEEKPPENDG